MLFAKTCTKTMPFFCKKYEQRNEQKPKSGLLLLLFGGWKQYIIENQPITW